MKKILKVAALAALILLVFGPVMAPIAVYDPPAKEVRP